MLNFSRTTTFQGADTNKVVMMMIIIMIIALISQYRVYGTAH